MKENITKRDWETISTYLDGQLPERKLTRFESRLKQDQQLRTALDELRNTRHVLRNAPRLRAPRSFMLTPEMAGLPRRLPNLAPVFGWATAVASFLFVLFMIGDLFSAGGAIPIALNNIPPQAGFIAPGEQPTENEVFAQPAANTSRMQEPSTSSVGDSTAAEIFEGESAPEVAAAPDIESAPKEELTPMTKAIDMAAAEDVEANPVIDPTGVDSDAGVTFSTEPEAPDAEQEAAKPGADVNGQVEVTSVTETTDVASTPEQHLLAPPVEETEPTLGAYSEEELQPAEEAQPQLTEEVAQSPAARALPTEIPTEPSPTLAQESMSSEIPLASAPVEERQGSWMIGAEVILGLFALGAGLAWLYLRRRGG